MSNVLITGASSGIGYELAKIFAENKYNVILVARNYKRLLEISSEIEEKYKVKATIVVEDLSKIHAAKRVYEKVSSLKLKVDVLINNAGLGEVGFFKDIDYKKDEEIIAVNITALTEMTKLFSREMVKRKSGKILNVASTGSFMPGPFIAVYYATKAYVLSLTRALNIELKPFNVTVTALCPGAVKTNFSKKAGKRDAIAAMDPRVVAVSAYIGLKKNKKIIVPGLINKILIRIPSNIVSALNYKNQKKLKLNKDQ